MSSWHIIKHFSSRNIYGFTFQDAVEAFPEKNRLDRHKLFYYFAKNRNRSAKKRFLFLTDVLDLEWTTEYETMMQELGTGISLLDPTAPDRGRNMKKFGLKINVDPIRIKTKVLH